MDKNYNPYVLEENASSNVDVDMKDPVNCCLDGNFLDCPENPSRFKRDTCPEYMAQRCARNFDDKCDLYLKQLDDKDINSTDSGLFLRKVAEHKYCRLDTSDETAHCATVCEQVNPSAPAGSAVVCRTVGASIFRDPEQLYNLSKDFSQTAKLDSTAPIKFGKCPKTCDVLNLNDFSNGDKVLNECLDRGVCQDVITDLSKNIVKNKIAISNDRLQNFINQYIVTDISTQLSQATQLGSNTSQVASTPQPVITPGPNVNVAPVLTPTPPSGFIRNQPRKEGFSNLNDLDNERGATMANHNDYVTLRAMKQSIQFIQQLGGLVAGVAILAYIHNEKGLMNMDKLTMNEKLMIGVALVLIIFSLLKIFNII